MSKVPAHYAEDITTAGTDTDRRRYDSKSLSTDRYHGVSLDIIRVWKFVGSGSLANRMRKELRLSHHCALQAPFHNRT